MVSGLAVDSVLETVEALRRMTGAGPYVVPNGRSAHKPMSENALGYLLNRAGYHHRHVPHGWRSTFSTLMNERFPADRAIIDLMLAHVPKDKVESAEGLELVGLMGVPPLDWEPDRAFARLQTEHQRVRRAHPQAAGLSAGMSDDLESAVKHGSTCVRVGTALLGQRPLPSPSIVTPVTSSSQTPE